MKDFEYYKKEFTSLQGDGDTEVQHLMADNLIQELLFNAVVNKNFTEEQISELIELYDSVDKWYA